MNGIGKIFTIMMVIVMFIAGNAYIVYSYEKFSGYMQLCEFIAPLTGLVMVGKVIKSSLKERKGK